MLGTTCDKRSELLILLISIRLSGNNPGLSAEDYAGWGMHNQPRGAN